MVELRVREEEPAREAREPRRRARRPRLRRQLLGLVGITAVAAIIAGTIAAYSQVFTPGVPATVLASRAGLLMSPGASVTLYGADVGRVTSITPDGDQARIGISVNPGQVVNIPADVRASIQAPTVFGPKFLSLVVPAHEVAQRLQAGQVIEPAEVPTEIDQVFANLVTVLNTLHPARLSATLGAISTALQGQGTRLGQFIVQLNDYLRELNPSLPALSADLKTASPVLKTFTAAAPDLVATLGNLRTTSGTLVSHQAQFDAFLVDLTGFSGRAQGFLDSNGTSLQRTLSILAPVTGQLAYYSPEFPCLMASSDELNHTSKTHRIAMTATFAPPLRPYTYPKNLPVVRATGRPSCYGGPITTAAQAEHFPLYTFDDGTQDVMSGSQNVSVSKQPLAVQLFGPSGAAAAEKAAKSGKGK